jgi:predicted nucleic acid-binding protein
MPKAVFDSTILVSAFLAPQGISQALLEHAVRGAFELYLSEAILQETQGVLLTREHLRRHYVAR